MEFDNSFEVPVPVDEAWDLLMDIERIAPCVPGAELTEVVDDKTYKGKISVKLGPVALTFNGQTTFEELDPASHSAKLKAQGNDARGRGGAHANVDFHMEPSDGGAKVLIHTNLQLSGAVAQYGRGVGMVQDLAQQIIKQFADCLENRIIAQEQTAESPSPATAASEAPAAAPSDGGSPGATTEPKPEPRPAPPPKPEQAAPVQVGGLGLRVVWNAIVRGFRKLFGGK